MFIKKPIFTLSALAGAACLVIAASSEAEKPSLPVAETDGNFRKVVLDATETMDGEPVENTLKDPMQISTAADGRVFFAERAGTVKVWKPEENKTTIIGELDVFDGLEDGLLGIALDPDFQDNNWIYLYYSDPETTTDENEMKAGENLLSRFTLEAGKIDMASEKVMLRVATQREECCHAAGAIIFDGKGHLYLSTGDNTNPFASDGFAPIDERPGRSPWDAQGSSANTNDLRGKILRVIPQADGTIAIPDGNLFAPGTPETRPEIYIMGNRNPFRISFDDRTGNLFWGDVGPDAGSDNEDRGSVGMDEFNRAAAAGNYGWPHFVGDNRPYVRYDFEEEESGEPFDPELPINNSPNNTGLEELPPAQPAWIYYPYGPSEEFPELGAGGRTAMAGPVYHYDPDLDSDIKLPEHFDNTLFIYEWMRNWIIAVKLDENGDAIEKERIFTDMTFKRPMDMEIGPDGALYLIEWGTNWSDNDDTQIVRIEYTPGSEE